MRILLPLMIAAALLPAHAQGVCIGYSATGPASIAEATADWQPLPCVPTWIDKNGTGRNGGWKASISGVTAWTWCPVGSGWTLRWGAATPGDLAAMMVDAPTVWLSTDKLATLRTLYDKHIGRNIDDPELLPIWCPHWAEMVASMPQPQRWIVAKAALNANPPGTRPAFPWTNNTRSTTSNGRAVQGSACDPRFGRVEAGGAYFGVNGRTDQVALCEKAP